MPTHEGDLWDFLNNIDTIKFFDIFHQIFSLNFQESYSSQPPSSQTLVAYSYTLKPETTLLEISLGKYLHIRSDLDSSQ